MTTCMEIALHLPVASDVMSLVMSYFLLSFSHEMSWMRSRTELSQFLRMFPTYSHYPIDDQGKTEKIPVLLP